MARVDASASLMYYGARYYDTAIGRFIQPDSLIDDVYNPQDLNRYSYTRNNPVNYTDPTGYKVCADEEGQDCTHVPVPGAPTPGGTVDGNSGNGSSGQPDLGAVAKLFQNYNATNNLLGLVYYWDLPTQEEAFDEWYETICAGLCPFSRFTFVPFVKAIYMLGYADEHGAVGTYGGFYPYRTQLTPEENQHFREQFGLQIVVGMASGLRFKPDQEALIDLAKTAKGTGVTREEADILLQWADEVNLTPARGPEQHLDRMFKDLHIHIGPVDHIPIKGP